MAPACAVRRNPPALARPPLRKAWGMGRSRGAFLWMIHSTPESLPLFPYHPPPSGSVINNRKVGVRSFMKSQGPSPPWDQHHCLILVPAGTRHRLPPQALAGVSLQTWLLWASHVSPRGGSRGNKSLLRAEKGAFGHWSSPQISPPSLCPPPMILFA